MTNEEIKELLRIFNDSGVAEMEVQRGEDRVWMKRAEGESSATPEEPPAPEKPRETPAARPPAPAVPAAAPAAEPSSPPILVKSPIVGTFYESPSPEAEPFVKIGDPVEPGQVLCIIESMKLMNEIEAESAGVIEARLVQNGQAVEYGEPLFAIRPR